MMYGWDGGMSATDWTLMITLWVVLVAVIGLAVAKLFPSRPDRGSAEAGGERSNAERILDERLARGEIDVETHRRLRETLVGPAPGR